MSSFSGHHPTSKQNAHKRMGLSTYLWQFTQVSLANVFINPMVGLLHVRTYKLEGIGSGQEWEEFILLGLKIQNLWFWFTEVHRGKKKSSYRVCAARFQSKHFDILIYLVLIKTFDVAIIIPFSQRGI